MIETTLSGLIIASAGGLVWLAFNRPAAFEVLYWPLLVFVWVSSAGMFGFKMGTGLALNALRPILVPQKIGDAEKIIDALGFPSVLMLLWPIGATIALLILSSLQFLPKENPK